MSAASPAQIAAPGSTPPSAIQPNRKKQKTNMSSRLGSIENPRPRKFGLKTKVKGDYYYQTTEDGKRELSYWDGSGTWKCEHGRRKRDCKACGGSQVCEHGKLKRDCKACGGSQVCEHGRLKRNCKACGGSQVCDGL